MDYSPPQQTSPELKRMRRVSRALDSSVPLPGGLRIGLDGIIGLVPVVGDAFGAGVSSWIIWQAWRMGVPWPVLLRMMGNVALDSLIGLIPIIGDLFDFIWKANSRNVALVERYLAEPKQVRRRATLWLIVVAAIISVVIFTAIYFIILVISALWHALTG